MLDPTKDILVSVVKAANPTRYNNMVEKLQAARLEASRKQVAISSFPDTVNLANKVKASSTPASTPIPTLIPTSASTINNLYSSQVPLEIRAKQNNSYKKFEAAMLQNFVEKMFTSDTSDVFGKGEAGSIWRSMMSEAIAKQMAEAGGIGIAKMLEKQHKEQDQALLANTNSVNNLQNLYAEGTLKTPGESLYSTKIKNS